LEDAKKKLDKTLKRNLEGQLKPTENAPTKLIAPETPGTEQITETGE